MSKMLRGAIDSIDSGVANGWVANLKSAQPISINVMANDRIVGHGQADLFRKDLLEAEIGNGYHAYKIKLEPLSSNDGRDIEYTLVNADSGEKIPNVSYIKEALKTSGDKVLPASKYKLHYFPDYNETNPYQSLLYSKFEPVISTQPGSIDDAINEINLAEGVRSIFHVHWSNVVTAGAQNSHHHRLLADAFLKKLELFQSLGGVVLWTIHNALPHTLKFESAEIEFHQSLADRANSIILHSNDALPVIREYYNVEEAKVRIVPHGNYIDVYPDHTDGSQSRQVLGLSQESLTFGFVGQLRPYKGLDLFIDGMFELISNNENVAALIAGKAVWPYKPGSITKKCMPSKQISVKENYIDDEDLHLYINAADIVVLPYTSILTSGSVFLALSYSKPVVVPRLPALTSLCDLPFVFSYEPECIESFVECLKRISALGMEELALLGEKAYEYAEQFDWASISSSFREGIVADFNTQNVELKTYKIGEKEHHVEVINNKQVNTGVGLAICVVNYFSHSEVVKLYKSLKNCNRVDWHLFILDNSQCSEEFNTLKSLFPNATIVNSTENLGYAAGNNVLMSLAIECGYTNLSILNPDTTIQKDFLSGMLKELNSAPLDIHAPLVVHGDDASKISFYKASISSQQTVEVKHIGAGAHISSIEKVTTCSDTLNGCALFLTKEAIDKYGYIPEEYFLYFEETAWCTDIRKKGGLLKVHPAYQILHHKQSQQGGLPTVFYTYYLLRGALLFAKRFGYDVSLTQRKYERTFVEPWSKKIAERAPNYLPLFQRLAALAFQHGQDDMSGKVDLWSLIQTTVEPTEVGYLELVDKSKVVGWASSKVPAENDSSVVLFVVDGVFVGSAAATFKRLDVKSSGFAEIAGFSFELPKKVSLSANSELVVLHKRGLIKLESLPAFNNSLQVSRRKLRIERLNEEIGFNFRGYIDGVQNGRVLGWLYDSRHTDRALEFELKIDGRVSIYGKADKFRSDLKDNAIGNGYYGFEAFIPSDIVLNDSAHVELKVLGEKEGLTEREVSVYKDFGFDVAFGFKDLLKWSYVNVMTPYGQYEHAQGLQNEMAIIKGGIVNRAKSIAATSQLTMSIIMPAYNRSSLIKSSVDSVIAQSYSKFELIIVDDGSSDDTVSVVKKIIEDNPSVNIRLFLSDENQGVSKARNIGLEEAKGDIVTYLDSDNVWDLDYLLIINSIYVEHSDVDTAYAGQEIWHKDGVLGSEHRTGIRLVPYNRSLIEKSNFIDLNIFSHRTCLLKSKGAFREDMKRLVDWELISRYTEDKTPYFIPALMNKYYFGLADNQITNVENYEENLISMHKKRGLV